MDVISQSDAHQNFHVGRDRSNVGVLRGLGQPEMSRIGRRVNERGKNAAATNTGISAWSQRLAGSAPETGLSDMRCQGTQVRARSLPRSSSARGDPRGVFRVDLTSQAVGKMSGIGTLLTAAFRRFRFGGVGFTVLALGLFYSVTSCNLPNCSLNSFLPRLNRDITVPMGIERIWDASL